MIIPRVVLKAGFEREYGKKKEQSSNVAVIAIGDVRFFSLPPRDLQDAERINRAIESYPPFQKPKQSS